MHFSGYLKQTEIGQGEMEKLDNPWLGCQEEDIHCDSQHQDVGGHLATEHKVVFKTEGNLALNKIAAHLFIHLIIFETILEDLMTSRTT